MRIIGFTTFLSWFFFVTSVVYILYSSSLLLSRDRNQCNEISFQEKIGLTLNNLSSIIDEFHKEEEEVAARKPNPIAVDSGLQLKHIVFGIAASSKLWDKRKEYIKLWWRPTETRGVVWVDKKVSFSCVQTVRWKFSAKSLGVNMRL